MSANNHIIRYQPRLRLLRLKKASQFHRMFHEVEIQNIINIEL